MIVTAGKFKGQKVVAPDENITRPTLSKVRMSIFNTLQAIVNFEGSSFLDMFAGSGIMGLEALSRGFSSAVAIEKNPKVARIIKGNFNNFSHAPKLLIGDSTKITTKLAQKFDVIYIDPPYFSGVYEKSLDAIRNISSDIVILEHVVDIDFRDFEVIKQKKYGDKFITFLRLKQN